MLIAAPRNPSSRLSAMRFLLIDSLQKNAVSDARSASVYQWIIDPLDGTTNFAHGFPFYAVSIGLEYAGRCVLGVVFDPIHDELFTAVLGQGAFLNGRKIQVSSINQLNASLLVTGFAYDIRDNPNNNLDHFARVSLRVQGMRRTGSAALDLCYVASGRFDAFWEVRLQPWDMAAGIVILQEAGGLMSSFQKDTFSIYGQELVASNGLIHDELLDAPQSRLISFIARTETVLSRSYCRRPDGHGLLFAARGDAAIYSADNDAI